jgi:hypothetical protein
VSAPPAKKPNPPPSNAKTAPAASAQKRPAAPAAAESAKAEEAEPEAKGGIAAMFVGVPKGIAYYLLNVPKLLVNPLGTVRKTIEELPTEPLGKTAIIGYAVPSLFIASALPSIGRGIGLLIGPGHTFDLFSFIPISAAITAVVGALISGFFFDRVFAWVITKLKGKSDARSRSNYFLQMQTVAIVLAVPSALGAILSSVAIPFINLLGPLLMTVGSLVTVYVVHQWMAKFEVVKWVLLVLKICAVLALLGAGSNFVTGLIANIRGLGSGGSAAIATGSGDSDLGDTPPSDPEEAAEWAKKKQAEAMAKATALQKNAQAAVADAQDKADDAKDDPPPAKPEKVAKPEKAPEKAPPPEKVEKVEAAPPPAKDNPPAAKDEPVVAASNGYATFARRRDAVEKLLEADPTVLKKNTEVRDLYADFVEASFDLDKKMTADNKKKPERSKLNARLRDAELYERSGKTIDSLAAKLGIK